jgi:hypothetical protein
MARPPSGKTPVSAEAIRQQRWEILQRDRAKAAAMRSAWPDVDVLHVRLEFADGTAIPPSVQSHQFNPPAKAFFRFPCPFADCSGEFELGPVVSQSLEAGRATVSRRFACEGVRARDRVTGHKCGLRLEASVRVDYRSDAVA